MIKVIGAQNGKLNGTPLSHARILYKTNQISAGWEAAQNPLTYDIVEKSFGSSHIVGFQNVDGINAMAIAVHNLDGKDIRVFDGSLEFDETFTVEGLDPIFILFPETGNQVFLTLSAEAALDIKIGVFWAGKTLDMARPIYAGHKPIMLNRVTKTSAPRSVNGQALGFTVRQEGRQATYEWQNLDPTWYREKFDPFVEYATRGMGYFFIAWRPNKYPDTAYGALNNDVAPENSGVAELMNVSIDVNALGAYSKALEVEQDES